MSENKLQFKNELLQQIAVGLKKLQSVNLKNVIVTFEVEDQVYTFSLPTALDVIANDLYWDERGNWSKARIAKVST